LIARGIREESIKQEIEEVSEGASKEFTLENAIEKMEKEWENLNFVVINWKNRNIKIIQGQSIEEAQILLDDHCIKA
jgi:dynein heavy chain